MHMSSDKLRHKQEKGKLEFDMFLPEFTILLHVCLTFLPIYHIIIITQTTSNQQIHTIRLKLIPNLRTHANKATTNTWTNIRSKPKSETEATMENKLNGRVTMKHNNMLPEATMEVVTPSTLHICVLIIKETLMWKTTNLPN